MSHNEYGIEVTLAKSQKRKAEITVHRGIVGFLPLFMSSFENPVTFVVSVDDFTSKGKPSLQ